MNDTPDEIRYKNTTPKAICSFLFAKRVGKFKIIYDPLDS